MLSQPPGFARSAPQAAPDAMISIDDAGVIRFANREIATLILAREAAEAAREIADRANQGKSRFLATASRCRPSRCSMARCADW
jgi:hypothetical protein